MYLFISKGLVLSHCSNEIMRPFVSSRWCYNQIRLMSEFFQTFFFYPFLGYFYRLKIFKRELCCCLKHAIAKTKFLCIHWFQHRSRYKKRLNNCWNVWIQFFPNIQISSLLKARKGSVFAGFRQADCALFIIPPITQWDRPRGAFVHESAKSQVLFAWDIESKLLDCMLCGCVCVFLPMWRPWALDRVEWGIVMRRHGSMLNLVIC